MVTIRNERGREMFEAVRPRMLTSPPVSEGDRKPLVLETVKSDDKAKMGRGPKPAPRWAGKLLAGEESLWSEDSKVVMGFAAALHQLEKSTLVSVKCSAP